MSDKKWLLMLTGVLLLGAGLGALGMYLWPTEKVPKPLADFTPETTGKILEQFETLQADLEKERESRATDLARFYERLSALDASAAARAARTQKSLEEMRYETSRIRTLPDGELLLRYRAELDALHRELRRRGVIPDE